MGSAPLNRSAARADTSPFLALDRRASEPSVNRQATNQSLTSTLRFLITPNVANHYDQRMVEGLAKALRAHNHAALALPSPMSELVASTLCKQLDIDVLIQINRFRPTYDPLPAKVRHIGWFQDIFPASFDPGQRDFRDGDIVYTLGDASVLGLNAALPCHVGTLLTGVDESSFSSQSSGYEKRPDFSLCGYIPPPPMIGGNPRQDLLWYIHDTLKRVPLVGQSLPMRVLWRILFRRFEAAGYAPFAIANAARNTVEALYRPLNGDLDSQALAAAIRKIIAPVLIPAKRHSRPKHSSRTRLGFIMAPYHGTALGQQPEIHGLIDHFAHEYPRLLDRCRLVRCALSVSSNVELYGDGWQNHPEFRPYHCGFITVQKALYDIYRRSRLNLANNTHGLGLHSRTLECMAVGGFVFTHASPNDQKAGGIETSFEQGIHYGVYTSETFADDARYWLSNDTARMQAGARAAEVVRDRHLWRHRAAQILADLKR